MTIFQQAPATQWEWVCRIQNNWTKKLLVQITSKYKDLVAGDLLEETITTIIIINAIIIVIIITLITIIMKWNKTNNHHLIHGLLSANSIEKNNN